jgi:uncharacterized protein (DUF58 family)
MSQANRDFLEPRVLARLKALPFHSRMPMLGSVTGMHRSPHRGSSLEFAEYRKYVPGDDTRRLDWRAYGRSDRYYIKEFEADTNLRLCLIVDTSGSMRYTNGTITKLDYARKIAGSLAFLASQQGDAVGLYCAGQKFYKEIKPKRNATHLRVVLDEMAGLEAQGTTGLAQALHEAAEKIRQRALVVVVSDLFIQPTELASCFQHLRYRKHDVVVFHLLEQQEIGFEFDRPMRFVDLEGGAATLADPSIVANEYRKAVTKYLADLKTVVRDAAVDYNRISIDEHYGDVLARFLLERAPTKK